MKPRELILIIDFGSQYTQLITRRIREANVYSEIHSNKISLEEVKSLRPSGIILSGGPMSVYDEGSPRVDTSILKLGIPVLGICYGLQLICKDFNGKVEPAKDREYGKANLIIKAEDDLFKNVKKESVAWMSHGDFVTQMPEGFFVTAESDHSPICAISNPEKKNIRSAIPS